MTKSNEREVAMPVALEDWDINTGEEGYIHATGNVELIVERDFPDAKVFKRNAIDLDKQEHRRCLVGQLNGVRVYVAGNHILMTTRDIKL